MLRKATFPHLIILILIIGAAVAAFFAMQPHRSETPAHHPEIPNELPDIHNTKKWSIMFHDEFSGKNLDIKKWSTCYEWYDAQHNGCTNSGNNEQEWYLPEQVKVSDGQAMLTAEDKPVKVAIGGQQKMYPYRSGMISSGRPARNQPIKFDARYGYYEARIQMQGGQGIWPAFWLLPTDAMWPPEIDIMEFLGHNNKEVLQTYHWGASPAAHQEDSSIITGNDFTDGWHTYAVNWQPGKIEWFIDGHRKKIAAGPNIPNKPMQIILNLAIGGKLPGDADDTTPFPRRMAIDYVRAYGVVAPK